MNLETLAVLKANTKLTKISAGTITKAILAAVNKQLSKNNDVFTLNLSQSFLSSATGDSLDLLGDLLGVSRGGSTTGSRASIQKFYCNSGSLDQLPGLTSPIPTGTIVQSSDGMIQYRTVGNISFNNGDTSVFGSIEAVVTGSASNVGSGVLTEHGLDVPGLLTTNVEAVDNGNDSQTDDEYRYVLSKAITAAEAANETSIRLAALSVAGVSDVKVARYLHGIGTYGILVIGTTPIVSTTVLQNVFTAVDKVTALGEFCTVRSPRYIGLEVYAFLKFRSGTLTDDKKTVVTSVEDAVYDYINNIPMGEGFVRNELIQRIMEVSTSILTVDDEDTSSTKLAVHIWSPTIMDVTDGVLTTNRVREELDYDYDAFFDDKHVVEQNMQGYTHDTSFTPVTIEYE